METISDKTYVMSQLRRAMDLGKFSEAMALVSGDAGSERESVTDWQFVRKKIDQLLSSLPPQASSRTRGYEVQFDDGPHEIDSLVVGA